MKIIAQFSPQITNKTNAVLNMDKNTMHSVSKSKRSKFLSEIKAINRTEGSNFLFCYRVKFVLA